MNDFRGLYDIRDMVQSDKNFIKASFLRGVYYGDSYFNAIPKDIFMSNYSELAEKLITDRALNIKIACLKEDADVILGYSILSADFQAIIWVFVKTAWRQRGIAKSLLPQHPSAYMHLTPIAKTLLPKLPHIVFNPFYQITKV